jgi:hypothetical protein
MPSGATDIADIFLRFAGLHAALLGDQADSAWTPEADWLRFAAFAAVLRPGDPATLARSIRAGGDALARHAPWYQGLATPLRFGIAAMAVRGGHDARRFAAELETLRARLHDAGLRAGSYAGWDALAAALLHAMNEGRPLGQMRMLRIKALYDGMKRRHWWLTGPDDLPACVLLSFRPETVDEVLADIELAYHLLKAAGFARGDRLQSAASLLAVTGLPSGTACQRATDLAAALRAAGVETSVETYEPIAALCLLDHDATVVASRMGEYRGRLEGLTPGLDQRTATTLAADLAFLDLVRFARDGSRITRPAALADMLMRIHWYHGVAAILAMSAASRIPEIPPGAAVGLPYGA